VHSWSLDALNGRKVWLMSPNFGKIVTSLASCWHGWVAYLPGPEASTSVSLKKNSVSTFPLFPDQSLDPEGHWLFNYLNEFTIMQLSPCFTKLEQPHWSRECGWWLSSEGIMVGWISVVLGRSVIMMPVRHCRIGDAWEKKNWIQQRIRMNVPVHG